MTSKVTIRYQVIGRAVVRDRSDIEQHSLRLLYRGDGTPWWTCSAGLDLGISEEFSAQPGDFVTLTLEAE